MGSQIMHGTPPEKPYPTSKVAPSIDSLSHPTVQLLSPLSLPMMLSEQTPLSIFRPMGYLPHTSQACPEILNFPRPHPRRSLPSQEQFPISWHRDHIALCRACLGNTKPKPHTATAPTTPQYQHLLLGHTRSTKFLYLSFPHTG